MKELIQKEIIDAQNDINEYLKSDVPLENYAFDIDYKLTQMRKNILEILEKNL